MKNRLYRVEKLYLLAQAFEEDWPEKRLEHALHEI
jgi:hypothetical protein